MKGFTLIELLIVLCIIGILGAVAWPAYEKYRDEQKRSDDVKVIRDDPFDGYKNCSILVMDDFGYEQKRVDLPCDQIQGMPQ